MPVDVDVIVVGTGPAGTAAALTAIESGASVALLDRDDSAGTGILSGRRCFGAGTRYQADAGITDSAEQALAEWDSFAGAGGSTEGVVDFVQHSAETLDWLVDQGMVIESVGVDLDGGSVARMHTFAEEMAPPTLVRNFGGMFLLEANVLAPVIRQGRVAGVIWQDAAGNQHTLRSHAVIMATGGFARDTELVADLLPELEGREALVEANLESDGGGISFLDLVGAGWTERSQLGVYVHGVADPLIGGSESLIGSGFSASLLVSEDGHRFGNEREYYTFDFFRGSPSTAIWSIFTANQADQITFNRPSYNVSATASGETMTVSDLITGGGEAYTASTMTELASLTGIDAEALLGTVADWNAAVAAGAVDEFGRNGADGPDFGGDTWYAVRIHPAVGKAFGGVSTSATGQVLTPEGGVVPGLYAAGEVAGMVLGSGPRGMFSGSVCACYYGGRVAGRTAAHAAIGLE